MRTLAAVFALLVLAAPAGAATVRVRHVTVETDDSIRPDVDEYGVAVYRAAPGERNRVRVHRRAGNRVAFRDRGAVIAIGRGCRRRTPHVAVCRVRESYSGRYLALRLGNRGDRVSAPRRFPIDLDVRGAAGDDRIVGGRGADALRGGDGHDVIAGRRGADTLDGGAGPDRLTGGDGSDTLEDGGGRDVVRGGPGRDTVLSADGRAPVDDRLNGGPGTDTISFAARRRPVTATVDANGGVEGETDRLVGFEDLGGGRAGDTLTGDDGPNRLIGEDGADTFDSRGGNDRILTEGQGDRLVCGDGTDHIDSISNLYLADPSCEFTDATDYYGSRVPTQPTATTADTVTMRLPCAYYSSQTVELRLPPIHTPWYPDGPTDVLLGTGIRPNGGAKDVCDTTVTLNDAGRALTRPVPVLIRLDSVTNPGWHFELR